MRVVPTWPPCHKLCESPLRASRTSGRSAHAALGLDVEAGREIWLTFSSHMDPVTAHEVGWTFDVAAYRKQWNGACHEVMRMV